MTRPFPERDECLNRGNRLLKEKKYREAIAAFEAALKADERSARAYLGLARAHVYPVIEADENLNDFSIVEITESPPDYPIADASGKIAEGPPSQGATIHPADIDQLLEGREQAIAEYEKAIELDPGLSDAYAELGAIYVATDPGTGFNYLYRALQIDPDNALALWIFGQHYMSTGRAAEAVKIFTRALIARPDNHKYWFSYAQSCVATGNRDKAIEGFSRAVALKPNFKDALFNLGTEYYDKGDFAKSRHYYRRFLALEPYSQDARFIIGLFPDLEKNANKK